MNIRIFRTVPAIEKKILERGEDRYLPSINLARQLHRSLTSYLFLPLFPCLPLIDPYLGIAISEGRERER